MQKDNDNESPRRRGFRASASSWLLGILMIVNAIALVLVTFGLPASASAHADLIKAEPPINTSVRQAPTQLNLYFSQGVKPNGSFVVVEDGKEVALDTQVTYDVADNKIVHVAVPAMAPGVYNVRWQTLSADDDDYHIGDYKLTVLNPDGSEPAGAAPAADKDDSGGSDTIILVVVSVVVVAMVGGLGYYIRKTSRAQK